MAYWSRSHMVSCCRFGIFADIFLNMKQYTIAEKLAGFIARRIYNIFEGISLITKPFVYRFRTPFLFGVYTKTRSEWPAKVLSSLAKAGAFERTLLSRYRKMFGAIKFRKV